METHQGHYRSMTLRAPTHGSYEVAEKLDLEGDPIKLTVCGINSHQVVDTKHVNVTVRPIGDDVCE